jgi:hypothetical protein
MNDMREAEGYPLRGRRRSPSVAIDGWHKRAAEVVESWNGMLEIRSEPPSMTNDHTGATEEGDR